ncbi:MAG: hypothetical protein F6J97_02995 [Leptolyngbya sp. SIO4C1]|nr:hypothetical protein [Leptolyngbya sp. SIO4C1]
MTSTLDRTLLDRSKHLKQALLDFVLEAEGDLAVALESFSADQSLRWSKHKLQSVSQANLAIDMFLTEGRVADRSVLDLFAQQPAHSAADRALLASWHRSFHGLFTVVQADSGSYELMNWLTEKHYRVVPNGLESEAAIARLRQGEIIVARLSPLDEQTWTFSGPMLLLGKLGKPKLAVAIGNFKNWFPQHLYGDAPDLLEAAWQSVERYHTEFVDFFGGDQITLSGYDLSKKLKDYQEATTQRRLAEAGLDSSKSLKDLADQAGVSEAELEASVEAMGEDGQTVRGLLNNPQAVKMMMPPLQLPDDLKRAEAVTVLVHPRWGQTFLKDYVRLSELLDESSADAAETVDRLTLKYLKQEAANAYVWHCLAAERPAALTAALRRVLDQPDFELSPDLDATLARFEKPLEPQLPEIASVPLHLHNLFQEALQEVGQSSSKKKKAKKKTGFGA